MGIEKNIVIRQRRVDKAKAIQCCKKRSVGKMCESLVRRDNFSSKKKAKKSTQKNSKTHRSVSNKTTSTRADERSRRKGANVKRKK